MHTKSRPIFFQASFRIALVYQSICCRTITNRLYYNWIDEKNLDGMHSPSQMIHFISRILDKKILCNLQFGPAIWDYMWLDKYWSCNWFYQYIIDHTSLKYSTMKIRAGKFQPPRSTKQLALCTSRNLYTNTNKEKSRPFFFKNAPCIQAYNSRSASCMNKLLDSFERSE